MRLDTVYVLLAGVVALAKAAMELPKFNQMVIIYPGYYLHGGKFRDKDIIELIGGNIRTNMHNTAAVRMSYVFNKFGGRHAIGEEPIFLSKKGRDSYTGKDGQEYIYRNTAFGPFLAARYGNPIVAKPNKHDHTKTMEPFLNKQGIVRLVSYHKNHAGGHIALWDCDHFYLSRDWTTETHIISAEFWEAPDSYCPPKSNVPVPPPRMETIDTDKIKIVPRHNFHTPYWHEEGRQPRIRHQGGDPNGLPSPQQANGNKDVLWLQQ